MAYICTYWWPRYFELFFIGPWRLPGSGATGARPLATGDLERRDRSLRLSSAMPLFSMLGRCAQARAYAQVKTFTELCIIGHCIIYIYIYSYIHIFIYIFAFIELYIHILILSMLHLVYYYNWYCTRYSQRPGSGAAGAQLVATAKCAVGGRCAEIPAPLHRSRMHMFANMSQALRKHVHEHARGNLIDILWTLN